MQSPLSSVKTSARPRISGPSSYGTCWKPLPRRPMLRTSLPSFPLWRAVIYLAGTQTCRMISLQRGMSGLSRCSPQQLQPTRQQYSVPRIKWPTSDSCSGNTIYQIYMRCARDLAACRGIYLPGASAVPHSSSLQDSGTACKSSSQPVTHAHAAHIYQILMHSARDLAACDEPI